MRLVVLGLSLSSSWGNGHATTFRALLKAFAARGHDVLFLERAMPWYAASRDVTDPDYCRLEYYDGLDSLERWRWEIGAADAVILGSYVPEGVAVGRWIQAHSRGVTAFYDIDTPVTLAKLERGDFEYLSPEITRAKDLLGWEPKVPLEQGLKKTAAWFAQDRRAAWKGVARTRSGAGRGGEPLIVGVAAE